MALVGAILLIVMFVPFTLITFPLNIPFPKDFLFARMATFAYDWGNHTLIVLLNVLSISIITLKRVGVNAENRLKSKMRGYFAYAVRGMIILPVFELTWFFFYILRYGVSKDMIPAISFHPFNITALTLITSVPIIALYVYFWKPKDLGQKTIEYLLKQPLAQLIAVNFLVQTIWFSYGFHVTILFGGASSLVFDPWTNATEIVAWAVPTAFWIFLNLPEKWEKLVLHIPVTNKPNPS